MINLGTPRLQEPQLTAFLNELTRRAVDGTNQGGTAVLVNGSVTINNARVQADSLIFLFYLIPGMKNGISIKDGVPGTLAVTTITAGTSFTVQSSNGWDASTIVWFLF